MTDEKIYFQWQNKILRKTIYPVRDMKLHHFLLYYKEIDLWAENKKYKDETYKGQKIEDLLPEATKQYIDVQKQAIALAFNDERRLRGYFTERVPEINSEKKYDEIVKLNNLLVGLHKDFGAFFKVKEDEKEDQNAKVDVDEKKTENVVERMEEESGEELLEEVQDQRSRDRKEKIFAGMRLAEWERYLKEMKQKIAKKQLLGIGIGLAGIVDAEDGILRQSPIYGWDNVPLRDMLQSKLHIPVYIENDVNTLTLTER